MLPEQFGIGPFAISIFGIFVAFSFVVASFLLWRSLKEDFLDEEIITFTIFIVIFSLLGGRIFYIVDNFSYFGVNLARWVLFTRFPGFALTGAYLGAVSFTTYWSKKKNWDFWVLLDSLTFALLVSFLIGDFGLFLSHTLALPLKFFLALAVLVFALFIKGRFRKFIWYKSGKPGFVAASSTAVFFLGNLVLDFWVKGGLYLEMVAALAIVFLALGALYQRSEREIKEDIAALGNFLGGKFVKK